MLPPPARAQALELGSTVTGGNFNSVQDWQRLALIAGVAGVALLAWRSYGSVTGAPPCLVSLCVCAPLLRRL
mgnify:CR=1 FL=1